MESKNIKILLIFFVLVGVGIYYYVSSNSQKCNIKGNISDSGDKIYHLPDCASYDKTSIDESKGEKMFCSEREATDAGWRKAKNCGK